MIAVFETIGDPDVVINVLPKDDLSEIDLTIDVVPDKLIVDIACASIHRDRPGRREGLNLSSFKTFAMAYTVMYLPEIYVAFITFWIETTETPE